MDALPLNPRLLLASFYTKRTLANIETCRYNSTGVAASTAVTSRLPTAGTS